MLNFLKTFNLSTKEKYPTWADIPPLEPLALPYGTEYTKMTQPIQPSQPKEQTEFFRVGITKDGLSTLTLIGDNNFTMTITLCKEDCLQMIRMLKSTMEDVNE
jgi:hypothetical protein